MAGEGLHRLDVGAALEEESDVGYAAGVDVPEPIKDSVTLTVYAVSTRYPGNQEPVDESEYTEAVKAAEKVCHWVKGKAQE